MSNFQLEVDLFESDIQSIVIMKDRAHKLKENISFKRRNLVSQRKRRKKVKGFKDNDNVSYKVAQKKLNRHMRKYRRKKRASTPLGKLKRYRRLLCTELSRKYVRGVLAAEDGEVFNLDSQVKLWRNCEDEDEDNVVHFDFLREFVDLQLSNDFRHPSRYIQVVKIIYQKTEKEISIPITEEAFDDVGWGTILLADKKLFYWNYSRLVTTENIVYELIYTKKSNPEDYVETNLVEFLQGYDMSIDSLC